jgi:hypothetical protein
MKFIIKKISLENTPELMRKARYRYMGQSGEQMSFVRAVGQNPYPRFHVYLNEDKTKREVYVTLHLDQKKMSYKGSTAHSGDYDGDLMTQEAKRIKEFFKK